MREPQVSKYLVDLSEPTGMSEATTAAIKAQDLEYKRQEKIRHLGNLEQGNSLGSGYSLTNAGTVESNNNKIWNDMTDAEIQGMIGEAASKYQIYKDGDKYYQGTGEDRKEYTGKLEDLRRAYMYGTKTDPDSVKFGLSRGDLPNSDYRYQPGKAEAEGYNTGKNGYGWDAGEDGVDLNKKYMDMLLPFNVATALEAAVHGREQALANRQQPDYLSDDAIEHASGVSEYYNSAEGMLGDTSGLTKEKSDFAQKKASDRLDEYMRLQGAQLRGEEDFAQYGKDISYNGYKAAKEKMKDSNAIDAWQAAGYRAWSLPMAITKTISEGDISYQNLVNNIAAFQRYADLNAGYDTSKMSEAHKMARASMAGTLDLVNKGVGLFGRGVEAVGDSLEGIKNLEKKFIEKEKARLAKYYPDEAGVSSTREHLIDYVPLDKVGKWVSEVGKGIQKDTVEYTLKGESDIAAGYSSKDVNELQAEVGETIKEEGYIAALGKAVKDERSLQMLSRSLPEMLALAFSTGGMAIVNVNHNINVGEAKLGREFTAREKALSTATSIVSTYIDRAGDKLALNGMNSTKMALAAAVENAPAAVKNALASTYGKGILAIGEAPLKLTGAVLVQGETERLQTLGETAAQRPDVFKDWFTKSELEEADVARVMGGAMGAHMATPVVGASLIGKVLAGPGADRIAQQQKIQEILSKTEEQVTTNMSKNLDMSGKVEIGESDIELENALNVDSMNRIYSDSETVDDMKARMNTAKQQIVNSVYTTNEDLEITGIRDASKLPAAEKWMQEYAEYQKDENGNIPKGIQIELDYIAKANKKYADAVHENLKEEITSAATNKLQKDLDGMLDGMTAEEKLAKIDTSIDEMFKEFGIDDKDSSIKGKVTDRIKEALSISGFNFGNGVMATLDAEAIHKMIMEEAGLKTSGVTQRVSSNATYGTGKATPIGVVTNDALSEVMSGYGVDESAVASDLDNTKVRERVLRRLDPTAARNVTQTLSGVNAQMDVAIANKLEEGGRYFKGDVAGNMKRLMVLVMNAVDSAVKSDTELRKNTVLDDSMLKNDEYYAGLSNVLEQAGKNFASSYGIKLTGNKVQMAKAYRDLGRFGVELAKDAGLVEVTNDNMWTRVGDTAIEGGGRLLNVEEKKGVVTTKGEDSLTGKDVLLAQDKGIRLTDTNSMRDVNDRTGKVRKYNSKTGDAIKRVSKLLLPGNERVPSTYYFDKPLKTAEGISIDAETKAAIKRLMKRPMYMKTGTIRDVLEHLNNLNKATNGGLNSAISRDDSGIAESLKVFLGLKNSGSELLEDSDAGSTMGRLDNLIGILDNFETLTNEDGVYYTYQVDINNRMTLVDTVANFQSDKVIARVVMGGKEYTVKGDKQKEVLMHSLRDEMETKEDKSLTDGEFASKYGDLYDQLLESTNGDMDKLIRMVANNMGENDAFGHMRKLGGFKILSLLEAARDVRDAVGGEIRTQYRPEKDASASGVFNALMNMSGRDPKKFKGMLERLGVKFKDGEVLTRDTAYELLTEKVNELIGKMGAPTEGRIKLNGNVSNELLQAVKKINDTLEDPKLLRNLAKYPIMTWFYSAGKESIVENLTVEMTKVLVEKAINGDEKSQRYLTDVIKGESAETMTAKEIARIKKGSKEHKALRKELNKIGTLYYSQLDEAFPEVSNFKKEMEEYFEFMVETANVEGNDFWNGRVRTALGAINGTNMTMSLYKWKNAALSMSAQEKIDKGLATEDESLSLITVMDLMPNMTSMMPLMMHSMDAGEAIKGLNNLKSDTESIMSIHDGFISTPDALIDFQEQAEETTLDIAKNYDMVNEMAWTARDTAERMRMSAGLKKYASIKDEILKRADLLDKKADMIDKANNGRLEAKDKMLDGAQTTLFGEAGYLTEEAERTVEEAKEVTVEDKVEEIQKDVYDALEEMIGIDERAADALGSGVKLAYVTEEVKNDLRSRATTEQRKVLDKAFKEGRSFTDTKSGTVYLGQNFQDGKDEITGKKAEVNELLDVVMHEIEHVVSDAYIDANMESAECKALIRVLDKALNGKISDTLTARTRERVMNVLENYKESKAKGLKELVATYNENSAAVSVLNELNRLAGLQGNMLERFIGKLRDKIRDLIAKTPLKELLGKTDVYTLGVAIQSIKDKARGEDPVLNEATEDSKEEEGIIQKYIKNIDPIC